MQSGSVIRDEAAIKRYGANGPQGRRTIFYPLQEQRVNQINSRYGIYWRGIERPNDRQMGIAGSEILFLDLETNETVAIRRSFILGVEGTGRDIHWFSTASCPDSIRHRVSLYPMITRVFVPVVAEGKM